MEKEQKEELVRVILAAGLFVAAEILIHVVAFPGWGEALLMMIPYLVAGFEVLKEAVEGIFHGELLDEAFLMALATVGAFAIGEYPEAVFVMVFYELGEWFQDYAVDRSRKSIAALMDIRPDHASVERDGKVIEVAPEEVQVGEVIVVSPGERVALDGVVVEGSSTLDTAALTGESLPRDVSEGEEVVSGCVNLSGVLRVEARKAYGASTVSKILDLVENSREKKAKAENFITKFARYYTPAVVAAAVAVAVLPPLLGLGSWSKWIYQALSFLVISCPCALVISVPLSFFGGMGGASRQGILVKGGNYLEALAKTDTVVFDKTGTLTQGVFAVAAVHPLEMDKETLLEVTALAEGFSSHPIAKSIRAHYGKELDLSRVGNVTEKAGRGLEAEVDGVSYFVGNNKLMDDLQVDWRPCHQAGTTVHIATQKEYLGHIVISDQVKPDSEAAIRELKALGVSKTVMLTGDSAAVGEAVAKEVGVDAAFCQLLPGDKVDKVEELLRREGTGTLVFVGDGINDAPVLTRADVGVAMGALGSDAAIDAADVVLMDDKVSKIATAIRVARKTMGIVRENIVLSLGVKAAILILVATGHVNMWLAVFADVGVAFLATLNALRCLGSGKRA